jgi:hypothetical protein
MGLREGPEQVAEHIDAIRSIAAPLVFPVAPNGQLDHIRYNFEVAQRG